MKILMDILLIIVWLVAMMFSILGGVWVAYVGMKEIFEIDILIRFKEKLKPRFAPKLNKAFYGEDGALYISIPREVINNAKKMVVNTESLKEKNNG